MNSAKNNIIDKVKKAKKGSIFFTEDFRSLGTDEAIRVALSRLVRRKILYRLARGIYAKPYYSKVLDKEVLPGAEEVAKALAKRDKARIIPTGNYALNALGLSHQVPMKIIYLTDASHRKVKLKNSEIIFRPTTSKNLSYKSEVVMLVVQALKEIGKGNQTKEEEEKILAHLKKVDVKHLKHDLGIAQQWISEIMAKALEK